MKIGELFVALGFKGDSQMLKTLDNLKIKTMHYSNQISSAIHALNDMTAAARQHAVAMDIYEKTTGKSADQLQKLSFQAAQFNVTQDELAATLKNIQQITTNVRLGRGMPSAFTLFGIDPNQDPVAILSQLQHAIKTLDSATALNIAQELGIDDKTFYMLKMTGKGMETLNKQYRVTAAERSNLVKLNMEWQKFWFLLKQITTKFQAATAKLQTDFIHRFLEMANRIADMASAFLKATEASAALKVAVVALGVALTAVFAPWLLILGAVFLVLEDIYTYFEGGDSITGGIVDAVKESYELLKNFEWFNTLLETIKGSLKKIKELIKDAKDFWSNDKMTGAAGILRDTVVGTLSSIGNILTGNRNVTQNNNIQVYGANSPEETADSVGSAVSNASYQLQGVN